MKIVHYKLILLLALTCGSCQKHQTEEWFDAAIATSEKQLLFLADKIEEEAKDTLCFPRSVKNEKIQYVDDTDWTSGFYPGSLWLCHELTGNQKVADKAREYTDRLKDIQYYTGNHDLGFMIYCSYGNAFRLKPQSDDRQIIVNTAESLITRYNSAVGAIRSWDFGEWSYPVIIDNMMNLELLFWASEQTYNPKYRSIAISHADKTLKNHFRNDMTSYHVVSYHPSDGTVESKGTFQGYSDSSAWSRGQAWALYGYTMCYRYTQKTEYYHAACKIARYIMDSRPSANDYIPYWDYDVPNPSNESRDASAAAITASALLELKNYGDFAQKETYFTYAENILKQLSTSEFLATEGTNSGFILKHSTGSKPHESEVDVPLNYADYYYLEAMRRYKKSLAEQRDNKLLVSKLQNMKK